MTIAFLINQTHKEEDNCTTSIIAFEALKRGHTVWYIGIADFFLSTDKMVWAYARTIAPQADIDSINAMMGNLLNQQKCLSSLEDIDMLWIRFDPTVEIGRRPWAPEMGIQFAERIKKMGKLVINDPEILAIYHNKLYLEDFPEAVRPPSIVTRRFEDVVNFMHIYPEVILKPVQGSTGKNVFYVDADHILNLRQTVEVLAAEGYFIVQKYLPEAREGDVRLYLLDGKPIFVDGACACMKRIPAQDDVRSNIHQGGRALAVDLTNKYHEIIDAVSSKLIRDKMNFVGLDIVGDKLIEININCAGGLGKANEVHNVNFAGPIVDYLENRRAMILK